MVWKTASAALLAAALVVLPAQAAVTIDFESGFTDQQAVSSVTASDGNSVLFQVGNAAPDAAKSAYIAKAGNPTTAFVSQDNVAGGAGGTYFLTDEFNGPSTKFNYFLTFQAPVIDLSLDLFDYRRDGGPAIGDTATLTVYSDLFTTSIGSDSWAIPSPNPADGNVVNLSVLGSPIKSAALVFSTGDVGTGIDNITYTESIPEPAALIVWSVLGCFGLIALRRRRRAAA